MSQQGNIMDIGQIGSAARAASWADTQSVAHVGTPKAAAKAVSPVITETAVQEPDATAAQMPVGEALQSINNALQSMSSNLQFSVDQESQRTIVKVVDQETKEVIRQMPTEEALEISKALDKLQGLLIKSQA
ncbi:flagella locus protein FlaG [Oxalicibacterium faecigallinarum]|uniref:Flagella locus protein FlaG n=2 Tax=Oxalicibacterium faecigallinarum TaxID=573741 RepID=A0A8J3ATN7_9BURK|nr:flagella locus protein FlaG [Oxalicibacterium faecigallinarum]